MATQWAIRSLYRQKRVAKVKIGRAEAPENKFGPQALASDTMEPVDGVEVRFDTAA
jgi:hypothetical protein